MIIVNQDKDKIINFEQMASLYVDSWSNEEFATEPNCFCIKAEKASDNLICMFLGEYATEERAQEVLQEIVGLYRRCQQVIGERGGVANFIYPPKVYEMPKE